MVGALHVVGQRRDEKVGPLRALRSQQLANLVAGGADLGLMHGHKAEA
ncbi:MAG: hypothetical protein WKF73_17000 [Nocardioidaceae bacterium]